MSHTIYTIEYYNEEGEKEQAETNDKSVCMVLISDLIDQGSEICLVSKTYIDN